MPDNLIQVEQSDSVLTLTLNSPDKLNALTVEVFEELEQHLSAARPDTEIACVVLQGAGRAFCAGHDLKALGSDADPATLAYEARTIDLLEALPVPTVARVHGYCLTGGLELALGCDLIVAAESARIGDTHGKWGLVPAWGMSVRLPERVGRSKAKELSFTSRQLDGREAEAIGLVDLCVPDDRLDAAIVDLTAEIVANSAGTNRTYKALYGRNGSPNRQSRLDFERSLPYGIPDSSLL